MLKFIKLNYENLQHWSQYDRNKILFENIFQFFYFFLLKGP